MSDLDGAIRRMNEIINEDVKYNEKAASSYIALKDVALELNARESGKKFFERFNEVLLFPYNNLVNGHREGIGYIRTEDGNIAIFVGKVPIECIVESREDFFKKHDQKTSALGGRQERMEFLNGVDRNEIFKRLIEYVPE